MRKRLGLVAETKRRTQLDTQSPTDLWTLNAEALENSMYDRCGSGTLKLRLCEDPLQAVVLKNFGSCNMNTSLVGSAAKRFLDCANDGLKRCGPSEALKEVSVLVDFELAGPYHPADSNGAGITESINQQENTKDTHHRHPYHCHWINLLQPVRRQSRP